MLIIKQLKKNVNNRNHFPDAIFFFKRQNIDSNFVFTFANNNYWVDSCVYLGSTFFTRCKSWKTQQKINKSDESKIGNYNLQLHDSYWWRLSLKGNHFHFRKYYRKKKPDRLVSVRLFKYCNMCLFSNLYNFKIKD